MAHLERVTRNNWQQVYAATRVALRQVEQDLGLSIRLGPNPSLSTGGGLTAKIYFTPGNPSVTPDENVPSNTDNFFLNPDQFRIAAAIRGVPADWLGKRFVFKDNLYTVVGASMNRARSVKFGINVRRSDGRLTRFAADTVRRGIAALTPQISPR